MIEPYVLMVPLFGSWGGRILTLGIILPEGLFFPRYYQRVDAGIPYLKLATYYAPLGSIFVGALLGMAFGKPRIAAKKVTE